MRASLLISLLFSLFVAGCASKPTTPPSKHISQSGELKVHPGLLGQPVPPELQPEPGNVAGATASSAANEAAIAAVDTRSQRSIYFDFDSASVKAEFNPVLQAHARYLAANPNARLRIEGNADERGPAGYNHLLALKRAENVKQGMIGYGVPEKQFVVKSLGESKPKVKGKDEESWAENRRADIIYEREN
jgi:peptidoglycan-associated lipoprotein